MKQSIKFFTFLFFALSLSFNMSAQVSRTNGKSAVMKKDKEAHRIAKLEKRANKVADKAEMDDRQRARFVQTYMDYSAEVRTIRKSKVEKTVKKEQIKELKVNYRNDLSTFLSEEQVTTVKKAMRKAKKKRKMKKGKKVKKVEKAKFAPATPRQ